MLDTFRAHPGVVPFFDAERIQQILEHPHLLGHIMGKTLLTEMHSEWIWHLWGQPEGIHTSFQGHRGSFKTTALTEVGSVWWLLFHPNDRLALLRKTFTEAADTLRVIERACRMPEIIHLFHCVQPENPTLQILEAPYGRLLLSCKDAGNSITKEVSLQAHGVDQLGAGLHFDRIHMDDIVNRQDRLSPAVRARTMDACREILTNIIDPGKTVQHTGTPWHRDDAWSLWTKKREGEDAGDDDLTLQAPMLRDCYQTGLLSPERLRKLQRTTTPSLFAANYKLIHMADDDMLFKEPAFAPWDFTIYNVHAHLDAKFDGDHTCALTFAARRPDGKIQIFGRVFSENVKLKIQWILDQCVRFKARVIHNELNPDKGYTADLLERKPKDERPPLRVRRYTERMNKHAKISSYLLDYWDELVFDPSTDEAYMSQVLDYMEGQEPDDAPDSLASILRQAFYPVDTDRNRNNALNEW